MIRQLGSVEAGHGGNVGPGTPAGEQLAVRLVGLHGNRIQFHISAHEIVIVKGGIIRLDVVAPDIAVRVSEIGAGLAQGILQGDDRTDDGHTLAGTQNGKVTLHTQQGDGAAALQRQRAVVLEQDGTTGCQLPAKIDEVLDGLLGVDVAILTQQLCRRCISCLRSIGDVGHQDLALGAQRLVHLGAEPLQDGAQDHGQGKQERRDKAERAENSCFLHNIILLSSMLFA